MVPAMKPCNAAVLLAALLILAFGGPAAEPPEFNFSSFRSSVLAALNKGQTNAALSLVREKVKELPTNFRLHGLLGEVREQRGEFAEAIKSYTTALDLDPGADSLYQRRGECHFRLGQITESIEDFDALLLRNPRDVPHHWQRGISHYYAGRFEAGRKQFELHQTVNSGDVENAVWHFLCIARQESVGSARTNLYPYAGDPRVPMKQIHDLFAGKGSVEAVQDAAEKNSRKEGPAQEKFYASLYLGLYFEVMGEPAKSLEWMQKAGEMADVAGYMGDVARVHLLLRKKTK
jgi:lipoprotein NlpI